MHTASTNEFPVMTTPAVRNATEQFDSTDADVTTETTSVDQDKYSTGPGDGIDYTTRNDSINERPTQPSTEAPFNETETVTNGNISTSTRDVIWTSKDVETVRGDVTTLKWRPPTRPSVTTSGASTSVGVITGRPPGDGRGLTQGVVVGVTLGVIFIAIALLVVVLVIVLRRYSSKRGGYTPSAHTMERTGNVLPVNENGSEGDAGKANVATPKEFKSFFSQVDGHDDTRQPVTTFTVTETPPTEDTKPPTGLSMDTAVVPVKPTEDTEPPIELPKDKAVVSAPPTEDTKPPIELPKDKDVVSAPPTEDTTPPIELPKDTDVVPAPPTEDTKPPIELPMDKAVVHADSNAGDGKSDDAIN